MPAKGNAEWKGDLRSGSGESPGNRQTDSTGACRD